MPCETPAAKTARASSTSRRTSDDRQPARRQHQRDGRLDGNRRTHPQLRPRWRDYEMGVGYAYAISTLFPNLFWKIHPAMEHELPSSWLTWQVDPYTASQGGGLGFSFIAEAYFNFGYIGVPRALRLRLLPQHAGPLVRRGADRRGPGGHGRVLCDLSGSCRVGRRAARRDLVLDRALPGHCLAHASPDGPRHSANRYSGSPSRAVAVVARSAVPSETTKNCRS